MAMFDTKYPNTARQVSGTPQLYNDDVILYCQTSLGPVTINLLEIPDGSWNVNWKLYVIDLDGNASVNNITINAGAGQVINTQASETISTNSSGALIRIASNNQFLASQLYIPPGGGGVQSVTGLDTDNTDPLNPIVKISVDGVTITGAGTPADPLIATAGSAYNTIEDEGVALPQRTTLNFIGPGVTAVDNAPNTDVTIVPVVIDITNANLLAGITASTLIKGAHYNVTDPTYAENVQIRALTTGSVGCWGEARFLYADYQGVGDYSGLAVFNAQLGVWYAGLAPVVGDVVIWNNQHWSNTTGANGAVSPDLDAVNWTVLTPTDTRGYIPAQEAVIYNPNTNICEHRWDNQKNYCVYANPKGIVNYLNIPWGLSTMSYNQFLSGATISNLMNQGSKLTFFQNIVEGGITAGYRYQDVTDVNILANTIGPTGLMNFSGEGVTTLSWANNVLYGGIEVVAISGNAGAIAVLGNEMGYGTSFSIANVTGNNNVDVDSNTFKGEAKCQINNLDTALGPAKISQNRFDGLGQLNLTTLTTPAQLTRCRYDVQYNVTITNLTDNDTQGGVQSILTPEYSNWPKVLDMTINYNAGTFDLNLGAEQYIGRYLVINGTGETINTLSGGSTSQLPFKLISLPPGAGINFRLSGVAIAGSGAGQIVTNASQNYQTNHNYYTDQNEYTELRKSPSTGTGQFFVLGQKIWT